jgi:Mn-dependent DtxR family transcriptional regulator
MVTLASPVDADLLRLRHEFLSMPGLMLTVSQTARLLHVRTWNAEQMLRTLEADGFLTHTPTGSFRRAEPPNREAALSCDD